jgi:hypothetical protein
MLAELGGTATLSSACVATLGRTRDLINELVQSRVAVSLMSE